MGIKLWLDDVRVPPDETWVWTRNVYEAIGLISLCEIDEISFDHDLGKPYGDLLEERSGYDVACTIAAFSNLGIMPRCKWSVHSANPVGRKRIEQAMMSAERFWD